MNFGIDMMQPVMLVAPHQLTPAEHIEHPAHESVDDGAARVALMGAIMHDVEPC